MLPANTLAAGQVYLGKYPPGTGKDRRFFIVTDEDQSETTVVWVYTSTSMSDTTVVLQPGDHPVITETCAVIYSEAQVIAADTLRTAYQKGALTREADLDPQILERVQEGLFESDETPISVVKYCTDRI